MFLVRVFFSAMAEELAHRLNVRKQKFAGVQSSKSAYALSADFVVFFFFSHFTKHTHTVNTDKAVHTQSNSEEEEKNVSTMQIL